jgi:tetratricopeptide (TPR) repeat protein
MRKPNVNCRASYWAALLGALAMLSVPNPGLGATESSAPSTDRARGQEEMKQGAQAYREGKYRDAEEHYRAALKLDPAQKSAALFLGRAIRAQYKPGVEDPENVARAKEAISVYEKALQADPNQDEAFAAVVDLYGALREDGRQRDWIAKRAKSEQLSKEKRSAAYRRLAELDLACARQMEGADPSGADRCAARGLESVDRAIALNGDNEGALAQKVQLLNQRAKLAESRGSSSQKSGYDQQAAVAEKRIAELREQERKKSESLPTY